MQLEKVEDGYKDKIKLLEAEIIKKDLTLKAISDGNEWIVEKMNRRFEEKFFDL